MYNKSKTINASSLLFELKCHCSLQIQGNLQTLPSPLPWHPSLATVLGNVSGALILIFLHVPSSIRDWMAIPTDAQPRKGGDWMESCPLYCASK